MGGHQVKGDLFNKVLKYVSNRWGKQGQEKLSNPRHRLPERWYDFEDFLELLREIDTNLGKGNRKTTFNIGVQLMTKDGRWQTVFKGKDPSKVLTSTKRQGGQYRGGEFSASELDPNSVKVEMSGWPCEGIWCEFYRGRLTGVLELTGRSGKVTKDSCSEGGADRCSFTIVWS